MIRDEMCNVVLFGAGDWLGGKEGGELATVIWNWEAIRWAVARVWECRVTSGQQSDFWPTK